ncbi:hypothetical protein Tco_0676234 [Tanacetum coccineum]
MSNPSIKSSDASPVKMEAPKELPKVSLVNESLKNLKFHLAKFDNVVNIRTTPDARIEDFLNEIMEVQTIFDQMEIAVQQSLVDKQCLEIAKKELLLENDRLLQQNMSQYVLLTMMNYMSLNGESVNMERKRNESCDKCFNLDAELLKTQNARNDLLKNESCNNQNAIEISEYFENNYLKAQLQDKDTTLYLKAQIQDKVFVITSLKNDLRKLKGKEIVDIDAQIPSANTIVPGMFKLDLEPLAPRPKHSGNKRNDRILQTPSRNMKNKVEAQPRKVNKKNHVVEPIHDVDVKHSLLNAKSKLICATCKKSMFDGVHDLYLLDFVGKFETQKPELKVYSRKPKNVKNIGLSKKAKIVESKNANHLEPNNAWGSNATDIPSSSSLVMTGCPDYSLLDSGTPYCKDYGYGDYQWKCYLFQGVN